MENAQSHKAELSAPNSANFTDHADKTPAADITLFKRLESQFKAAGLNLYPLDGPSLLATSERLQMYKVLPDMRTAAVYIRQIGGAA